VRRSKLIILLNFVRGELFNPFGSRLSSIYTNMYIYICMYVYITHMCIYSYVYIFDSKLSSICTYMYIHICM